MALKDALLTFFGDIKVFPAPMFIVYDPGSYQVTGNDTRALINVLEPGDILLRAYTNYLDGKFIPGIFSHAAIYCGEIGEADRAYAGDRIADPAQREAALNEHFHPGTQMVVHSMAEGVRSEDILTFSRCDYLVVLRLPDVMQKQEGVQPLPLAADLFSAEENQVRERLRKGEAVSRAEASQLAIREAIRNIGRPYDFDFDFADFARLSCSELVYFCYKAIDSFIDVQPRETRVLFISQKAIPPDAFLANALQRVWANTALKRAHPELNFP